MSGANRAPSSSENTATTSGRAGGDAGGGQRLDDLEAGEHAEVAVVEAAGAHRVDVGART